MKKRDFPQGQSVRRSTGISPSGRSTLSSPIRVEYPEAATMAVQLSKAAGKAEEIIVALRDIQVENDSNWNRRYRENMLRLKSGDLMEVARVMPPPINFSMSSLPL